MLELLSFCFFSVVVVGFFTIAVLSRNMLHALSALAGGMVFLSGFYFMLDAEFVGAIQIIVYSGAILGLYSFAMMFFDFSKDLKEKIRAKKSFFIIIFLCALLLFGIFSYFEISPVQNPNLELSNELGISKSLALAIFSKYLLAFEFIAILLLIALICAVVLTHKELLKEKK